MLMETLQDLTEKNLGITEDAFCDALHSENRILPGHDGTINDEVVAHGTALSSIMRLFLHRACTATTTQIMQHTTKGVFSVLNTTGVSPHQSHLTTFKMLR